MKNIYSNYNYIQNLQKQNKKTFIEECQFLMDNKFIKITKEKKFKFFFKKLHFNLENLDASEN